VTRRLLLVLCLALGAPLASFAQAPSGFEEEQFKTAGHKPIAGSRLREMLVGNTVYLTALRDSFSGPLGGLSVAYFRDRRSMRVILNDRDTGRRAVVDMPWWLDGDRLCFRYISYGIADMGRSKVEYISCGPMYDVGGVIYACRDGQCRSIMRVVPGNPEKL
jgi:hypothetical protein